MMRNNDPSRRMMSCQIDIRYLYVIEIRQQKLQDLTIFSNERMITLQYSPLVSERDHPWVQRIVTSSTCTGAHAFTPGCQWGLCYSIFSFICMFCRSLFVLLSCIFWPLCYLFFFDLWILIIPLVSSISSYLQDQMFLFKLINMSCRRSIRSSNYYLR